MVNFEKIDELVKRTGSSYKEAKEALERCNEDMVEAIIYIENQRRAGHDSRCRRTHEHSVGESIRKLIKKANKIDFTLSRREKTLISVPLTLAVPVALIFHKIAFIGIIIALITGHRISFDKKDGGEMEVNKVFDRISDGINNFKNETTGTNPEQR